MREALGSGVDLRLDVITRVERKVGPLRLPHEKQLHPVEIRFLPLTEQWQLSIDGTQRAFPRLWLLLDALAEPHAFGTGLTRAQLARGKWQVRARVRFNREALPAPIHLPALFSPEWRLAGRWHAWRPARS